MVLRTIAAMAAAWVVGVVAAEADAAGTSPDKPSAMQTTDKAIIPACAPCTRCVFDRFKNSHLRVVGWVRGRVRRRELVFDGNPLVASRGTHVPLRARQPNRTGTDGVAPAVQCQPCLARDGVMSGRVMEGSRRPTEKLRVVDRSATGSLSIG